MKTKAFTFGAVFGLFIAITLATRSQDKRIPSVKQEPVRLKKDSVIAPLPDTTIQLIKEVDSLKKAYDIVLLKGKEKLKTEEKFVRDLKGQNATLIKIARSFSDIDTLPPPKLNKPDFPEPDTVKYTEKHKNGFFERIFKWKK